MRLSSPKVLVSPKHVYKGVTVSMPGMAQCTCVCVYGGATIAVTEVKVMDLSGVYKRIHEELGGSSGPDVNIIPMYKILKN